jgi:threonine dehydrogenase-like Zn-dependent dehydrogenase
VRAAVMRGSELVVDEVPDPVPAFGQALVRVLACGICGSDLHFLRHGRRMAELSAGIDPAVDTPLDVDRDIVMGHEFCAEVLEYGPETQGPAPGTIVTSMPVMLTLSGVANLAYNNEFPGGYAERMLLSAPLMLPVPDGLDHRRAALTEPMAVGIHAVARSGIAPGDAALVIGCGPVGLAVVAALHRAGIEPIVAADPSPRRRALATGLGAHETTDPGTEPGIDAWRRVDGRRPLVVFEAVGNPGMIDRAMRDAPRLSRLVVVGVCMEPDTIQPFLGIAKELNVQFVLGYDPGEFAESLQAIAGDQFDVGPLITGVVGLDEVPAAFEELSHPDRHAKILVEP